MTQKELIRKSFSETDTTVVLSYHCFVLKIRTAVSTVRYVLKLENPPKTPKQLDERLREFEGYWQVRLNTLQPFGMNSINEYMECKKMTNLGVIRNKSYNAEI